MRRPLKPFVTEYKGNGRRTSNAPLDTPISESDRPAQRPFPTEPATEQPDGYEAAMRAADALFSVPSSSPGATPTQPNETSAGGDKNNRRILQALEEPPNAEMAALEAKYAEKRRGRKPGSKNKPKTPVADDGAPLAPAAKRGRPRKHPVVAIATVPAIASSAALPNAAPPALQAPKPPAAPKRGAWRGRARPGEAWKRQRLPPACW